MLPDNAKRVQMHVIAGAVMGRVTCTSAVETTV
jgi:hypothetical protein